jgi:hypothetical protein
MIIFDQEKLSAFFETVSRGFERSPLEITLVIVSFIAFVAVLIVIYRVQRLKIRRQRRQIADKRYRQILAKLSLSPSEEDLVRRMARYLKEPEKKYLILINQPTFNFCAAKLRQKDEASATSIAELRTRLAFRLSGPEQVPASSAELPEGQGLLILAGGEHSGRKAHGRVRAQEPRSVVVQLVESASPFREGEPVRVYFQNRSGLFSFLSTIQSIHDGTLRLQHGEEIKRIQRRRYYRKRISQPLAVRPAGSEEQPIRSTFFDLGGNGASLRNPGKRFGPGDALELIFLAAGERLSLVAEVLRTSKNGEVLHVRFAPMRETTRDRIIGSLFKGAPSSKAGP